MGLAGQQSEPWGARDLPSSGTAPGKIAPKQDAFIPLFVYKVCSGHLPYVGFTEFLGRMLGTPGMKERDAVPTFMLFAVSLERQTTKNKGTSLRGCQ